MASIEIEDSAHSPTTHVDDADTPNITDTAKPTSSLLLELPDGLLHIIIIQPDTSTTQIKAVRRVCR